VTDDTNNSPRTPECAVCDPSVNFICTKCYIEIEVWAIVDMLANIGNRQDINQLKQKQVDRILYLIHLFNPNMKEREHQAASKAVVLPKKKIVILNATRELDVGNRAWNECLQEFKRLNSWVVNEVVNKSEVVNHGCKWPSFDEFHEKYFSLIEDRESSSEEDAVVFYAWLRERMGDK